MNNSEYDHLGYCRSFMNDIEYDHLGYCLSSMNNIVFKFDWLNGYYGNLLFYRNVERITITLKGDSCKIMLSLQFYATINVIVIVFLTLRKLSNMEMTSRVRSLFDHPAMSLHPLDLTIIRHMTYII